MSEAPSRVEEEILRALRGDYGLRVAQLASLSIGADPHTSVYRAVADDETPYFAKVRRGGFHEAIVRLTGFLRDSGVRAVLAPIATRDGRLSVELERHSLVVYPFVAGRSALEVPLSEGQWSELGAALKRLHTAAIPESLAGDLQRESYSPEWREQVRKVLEGGGPRAASDSIARDAAALLTARRTEIHSLVDRADRLASEARNRDLDFVPCHADVHAGNVLVSASGELFIIDWDGLILAPKERDLMFFGGAQGFLGCTPEEEELHFGRGYGPVEIEQSALAYYRCERIVQDIAINARDLLSTDVVRVERATTLRHLAANFRPGGTIERAIFADVRARTSR